MSDLQPVPDAAVSDCDHYWADHVRGAHPLSVRLCMLCHAIDWGDLDEQAAALIQRYAASPRDQLDPLYPNGAGS
jgi:hypothetical protein